MKYIRKMESPASLEEYKKEPDASYKKLPSYVKDDIRDNLLNEQGGLCCYCGKSIYLPDVIIEHFLPEGEKYYPHLQLEYTNMLLSCKGGQDERRDKILYENRRYPLSCDAKKECREIKISPTDASCEQQFEYDEDGNIYGINADAQKAIQVLGLNNAVLRNSRKSAIEAYTELSFDSDEEWYAEIDYLESKNEDGLFLPFCFACVSYIKNTKLSISESVTA